MGRGDAQVKIYPYKNKGWGAQNVLAILNGSYNKPLGSLPWELEVLRPIPTRRFLHDWR